MSPQFIDKVIKIATYQKKETTKDGYYWFSGSTILPNRLTISNGIIKHIAYKGRNLQTTKGQLMGRFKKTEQSILMLNKPFEVSTQIWAIDGYPQFIGYGTVGISNSEGKITRESDKGDLVILHSPDNWQTIKIFFLPSMFEHLSSVMDYIITTI